MHAQAVSTINKSIAEVWEVMGQQFADVHLWSSNFHDSKAGGESLFEGIDYSYRETLTERGMTVQTLETFDRANHSLSYRITEGAPEIAKEAYSKWALEEVEPSITKVVLNFYLEPKIPVNEQMQNKIESGLMASAQMIADELKYYLEKGEPHPNKLSQLETKAQ